MTCAPCWRATWTAVRPTPPTAPVTRMVQPGCGLNGTLDELGAGGEHEGQSGGLLEAEALRNGREEHRPSRW